MPPARHVGGPNQMRKNGAVTRTGIVPRVSMIGSRTDRTGRMRALLSPSAMPTTQAMASATRTLRVV